MVDTGANVTALNAAFWRRIPELANRKLLTTTIDSIKAVSGDIIPVLGQVETPFNIDGQEYSFKALIIDPMTYDVILGRDLLSHYKAKIDLDNQQLSLTCHTFPLAEDFSQEETNNTRPQTCSIHATSSFIIPPHSEVLVPGELQQTIPEESIGIVEPRKTLADRYQIAGASTLVKVMPGHIIPIRLPKFIAGPAWVTFSKPHPNISTFTLVQSDLAAEAERDVPTATDTEPRVPLHVNNIALSPEQQARLSALLKQYDDVFAYTPDQLGRSSVVKHTIDTGDHPPIRLRSYRTSPTSKTEIEKHVKEMLDNNIICPSVSPWAFPVVLAKKSDGTLRFCVDYRKLNQIIDSHPIPRITEALDALGGARYFTTLDFQSV